MAEVFEHDHVYVKAECTGGPPEDLGKFFDACAICGKLLDYRGMDKSPVRDEVKTQTFRRLYSGS